MLTAHRCELYLYWPFLFLLLSLSFVCYSGRRRILNVPMYLKSFGYDLFLSPYRLTCVVVKPDNNSLLCNLLFYIPQNRVGKADRPSRCGQPCPTCRQVPGCGPRVGQTEWYSYCDTIYQVKGAKKHLPAVNKSIYMFQIWAKVIKRITPKKIIPAFHFFEFTVQFVKIIVI